MKREKLAATDDRRKQAYKKLMGRSEEESDNRFLVDNLPHFLLVSISYIPVSFTLPRGKGGVIKVI